MRLKSHNIEVLAPDAFKADGEGLVTLTNEGGQITLKTCSDFMDLTNSDPNALSVATLVELAYRTLNSGYGIPATHSTAWRAVHNNLRNALEAIGYSEQLLEIESAKPYSLPVKFTVGARDVLEPIEPVVIEYNPGDITVETYFELIGRLMSYHHSYQLVDGVLEIRINISSPMMPFAKDFCDSLIKKDAGFRIGIYNAADGEARLVDSTYVPGFLCKSAMELSMVIEAHYGDDVKIQIISDNELNVASANGLNVSRNFGLVIQKLEAAVAA